MFDSVLRTCGRELQWFAVMFVCRDVHLNDLMAVAWVEVVETQC